MAVKIARGTLTRIREHPEGFVLQVLDASDPELAAEALEAARIGISQIDGSVKLKKAYGLGPEDNLGPSYVAPVLPTAAGPFLYIDANDLPYKLLRTIPEIVRRELERMGVSDATIAAPLSGGTLEYLPQTPNAVLLRLYPSFPLDREDSATPLPPDWLRVAEEWVEGGLGGHDEVLVRVEVMEFRLSLQAVAPFLEQCQRMRPISCELIAGKQPIPAPRARSGGRVSEEALEADAQRRLGGALRICSVCFGTGVPNLVLGAGGHALGPAGLRAEMELLKGLARGLAPDLAYAYITVHDTVRLESVARVGWSPAAPQRAPAEFCESVAFDAFPYQVLGPGHIERLGGLPDRARPLAGERVELELWEPTTGPSPVKVSALRALRPCLVRRGEGRSIWAARRARPRPVTAPQAAPPPAARRDAEEPPAVPRVVSEAKEQSQPLEPWEAQLRQLSTCVELTLYLRAADAPDSCPPIPSALVGPICDWVAGGGEGELWVTLGPERFQIAATDAPEVIEYAQRTDEFACVAIDPDGLTRHLVRHTFRNSLGLRLRGGLPAGRHLLSGPAAYRPAIALADSLKQLAREVAPQTIHAHLHLDPAGWVHPYDGPWSWYSMGGEDPWNVLDWCDEFVFDAFHYQVLGPGHLRRLGGLPDGSRSLAGGRAEFEVGEPQQWLPLDQAAGRQLLAPCLITAREKNELIRARRETQ